MRGPASIAAAAGAVALALLAAGCGGGSSASPPVPLVITTQTLPRALINQSYSAKLQASGGSPPYTWTSPNIGIPGLTLASDGTLSGTPTQAFNFFPLITVTDSRLAATSLNIELDVIAPPTFSTSAALPDANVALPVFDNISVINGVQPYSFAVTSGTLPPGLSFSFQNSFGVIQGTPTAPGNYSYTIQATDSFTPPLTVSQTFTQRVLNNVVLPNSTLPDAVQNLVYSELIQPAAGTPPYRFALGQFAALPAGLQLDTTTGRVFGTPTMAQQFPQQINVLITDSASPPSSLDAFVYLVVQPPLTIQTTSLPDSARGTGYFGGIGINGGRGPYQLQITSGNLPNGLAIPATVSGGFFGTSANITGVPNTDGLFPFTLQVTDSYPAPSIVSQNYQIRISEPLTISGPGFSNILYNQSFRGTFPAAGGFPPYTWTMNPVPPGFTFDTTTGTLSGTPSASVQTNPFVSVRDSSSPPFEALFVGFSLFVTPKLSILSSVLPPVATGRNLLVQPIVTGGAGPYQSTITGTLPPGVSFLPVFSNSAFTGTPNTPGTYNFTLGISDANTGNLHQTASQALTWTVLSPGQMTRNDSIAAATPVSNLSFIASISPASDPSTMGPDVDVYSSSAPPGSLIEVYASANNDFAQPPAPNSLMPILEIVDANGIRYQTCGMLIGVPPPPYQVFNFPCTNGLLGSNVLLTNYFVFQVPGTSSTPVPFYVRVFDERGDARPDFIYTFSVFALN